MKRMVIVPRIAALMAAIVALSAGAEHGRSKGADYNETYPVSGEYYNPCTGETFTFEGTVSELINTTAVIAGNDQYAGGIHNIYRAVVHLQGVSDSGAKYVVHQAVTVPSKVDFDSASTYTVHLPLLIIRQERMIASQNA